MTTSRWAPQVPTGSSLGGQRTGIVLVDRGADEVVTWFPEALRPDDTWPLDARYRYEQIGVPADRTLVLWWD